MSKSEEIVKLGIYSFYLAQSNFPRHDLASQVVESSEEEQPEWALKLHLDVHLRATRQYVDVSSGFGGPAKSVRAFLDNHERHSTTQRLVLESVAKADHQSSRDVDRERQHGEQTYNYYQAFSYSQPIEQRQGSHRGQVLHHFGQIFQEEACRSSLGRLRATYPRERHVFSPRRQSVRSRWENFGTFDDPHRDQESYQRGPFRESVSLRKILQCERVQTREDARISSYGQTLFVELGYLQKVWKTQIWPRRDTYQKSETLSKWKERAIGILVDCSSTSQTYETGIIDTEREERGRSWQDTD